VPPELEVKLKPSGMYRLTPHGQTALDEQFDLNREYGRMSKLDQPSPWDLKVFVVYRGMKAHPVVDIVGIKESIKGEDCITALCGRKISLYIGRLSGQRTEECPPELVLGDSVMSGHLLISGRHLILTLPLVRKMQRNTGGENETASTETNSSRRKNIEKKSQYPRMPR